MDGYKYKTFLGSRWARIKGMTNSIFNDTNAISHSGIHSNYDSFLNNLENDNIFWADFETNFFNVVRTPFNFITSFLSVGALIWMIALKILGLASITLSIKQKAKYLPYITFKGHFYELSLMLYCQTLLNTRLRWCTCDSWMDFTTILSVYTSSVSHISSRNNLFNILW